MDRDVSAYAFFLGAQLDLYEHQFDCALLGSEAGDGSASLGCHLDKLRILTGAFPAMLADMIQVLTSHAGLARRRGEIANDAAELAALLEQHREGVDSIRSKCLQLLRAQ